MSIFSQAVIGMIIGSFIADWIKQSAPWRLRIIRKLIKYEPLPIELPAAQFDSFRPNVFVEVQGKLTCIEKVDDKDYQDLGCCEVGC